MIRQRCFWIVWALLFVIVGTQSLAIPRGAGPDEPAHLIRAVALVRGDALGQRFGDDPAFRRFEAPEWAGRPDPGCFAFQPDQPASCATYSSEPVAVSTAGSYPVFGHVLPGIASLVPGGALTAWASRLAGALVSTLLVAWAIVRLISSGAQLAVAAVLLALTPMAIFSMAVVNPSGLVIGGAIALWISADELARGDRSASWLFASGWAAVVLPRTDGLIWVGVISTIALLAVRARPQVIWRSCDGRSRAVVFVSTAVAALWLLLVPPALIEAPAPYSGWALVREILGRTGTHIRQAIGVVGWLDTAIPAFAFLLWAGLLGMLAGVALVTGERRRLAAASGALGAAVIASWVLEYLQASTAGLFWQGRYGLPLLVGVPIQLGLVKDSSTWAYRDVKKVLLGGTWIVWNFGFLQALRRWGVGENGSMLPWDWSTWSTPLPLSILIASHAVLSATLMFVLVRAKRRASRRAHRPRRAPSDAAIPGRSGRPVGPAAHPSRQSPAG